MITYKQFITTLSKNPNSLIDVYLPDGYLIPAHYHLTDVGCVNRYFIDCGGHTREENYIQIQLWLGKDINHRLRATTFLKILEQSQSILNKLATLEQSNIHLEYRKDIVTQYPITDIKSINNKIIINTETLTTQCLAALRHEKEIKQESDNSSCSNNTQVNCC